MSTNDEKSFEVRALEVDEKSFEVHALEVYDALIACRLERDLLLAENEQLRDALERAYPLLQDAVIERRHPDAERALLILGEALAEEADRG